LSINSESDKYFSSRFTEDFRRKYIWQKIAKYVDQLLPRTDSTLELGAGYCDWINSTESQIKYATDISNVIETYAAPEVKTLVKNSSDIDFEGIKFDRIQASNFLEHLDEVELAQTINRINSLLKSGGYLVLIQPNYRYTYKKYFDDYTHKKVFTHISLVDLFVGNNFKPLIVKKKFLPFTLKSKLKFGYKLINLYLHSPIKPFAGQMLVILQKN
jgi:hypothetical protein